MQSELAKAFKETLGEEGVAFFEATCAKPFDQQAVAFLNAYWNEIGSQAAFIFEVAYEVIKGADMKANNVEYIHKYEIGNTLEFNFGLYFYEQICKFVEDDKNKQWATDEFKESHPEMMTAIARKKELKEKVDVNFDGKITMLEYLLYQYRGKCSPAEFVTRSMAAPDEHPEIRKARLALEDVNKRIMAYEAEKARLEALAVLPGVKGLGAKNQLAQLDSNPLKDELNKALITAEAAVRIATKKFGGAGNAGNAGASADAMPSQGAIYWMNADLKQKKAKYGRVPGKGK